MIEIKDNPKLVEVWVAMADHFLDTETRQDIPGTAMRCVEAGLSVSEAREVWRREVSPAVGFNLWSVAGEWAGWDQAWLVERIERRRRANALWPARTLRDYLRPYVMDGVWLAITRHMEVLMGLEGHEARAQASSDMAALAAHCFDFCPPDLSALPSGALGRLRALYPTHFTYAMGPAFFDSAEGVAGHQRIAQALAGAPA